MNIFCVDSDPRPAAQALCDQHILKMPIETAQLLGNIRHEQGLDAIYAPFNPRHPCSLWAGESRDNYYWLLAHGLELCREFTYRYAKEHACQRVILWYARRRHDLRFPQKKRTPFRQCMPEIYRDETDAIRAYRNYYRFDKARFARWNHRPRPEWMDEKDPFFLI